MSVVKHIQAAVNISLTKIFNQPFTEKDYQINQIKEDFKGDYSIVLFSLLKKTGLSPKELGDKLVDYLKRDYQNLFSGFELIKGFLNVEINDVFWLEILPAASNENFGSQQPSGRKSMVEYASPNTNKPLHLGHLRNIFLGWSVAEILKANGNEVFKTCIVNDRGIHICKSMIAWLRFGGGETPQSSGIKGDHLVGKYYVKFNEIYKAQIADLEQGGMSTPEAEKEAPIMLEAQQMLLDWETGKPDIIELWKKMNGWVYAGFDETYKQTGSDFDKTYYESETYLLGKEIVQMGLDKGVFYKKQDGSVWIDLTAEGLDEKLVLRKDGTSVYITQDIGLALQKYQQFGIDENIYVIGDEQNYHMKVLKLICQKLNIPNADNIFHLSYGMVELPSGKMKSREGTVVDADDMISEMISTAEKHTTALGKTAGFNEEELKALFHTLGLGAMKFYLLRVDPKKRMIFNPEESIDFHGFTGPFIQYTHARIKSIIRKAGEIPPLASCTQPLLPQEKTLAITIEQFPVVVQQSAAELNPSFLANYIYQLAKQFNSFYTDLSVLNAESEEKKILRLHFSVITAQVLKKGLNLLGISAPERM
ncbi:MAG: arginine--tRNA ligase [Ferruginibacter sp.]|nr:arginine--tRNA ligase [Ferruginibacter sp.]